MRNTHIVKSQPIKNPPVGSAPIGGKHDHFIGGHDTGDTCTPSIRTCVSCQPTDVESMHSENLRSHRAMHSDRVPVVFVSMGDVMHTLDPMDPTQKRLAQVGAQINSQNELKAVVVVSACWTTEKKHCITTTPIPTTMHDHPCENMMDFDYPVPGCPHIAADIRRRLNEVDIGCTQDAKRGLDHGAWLALHCLFPDPEDCPPVCQLSLLEGYETGEHLDMGKALDELRDEGILIVGVGNAVSSRRQFELSFIKNFKMAFFRATSWSQDTRDKQRLIPIAMKCVTDWSEEFDVWLTCLIESTQGETRNTMVMEYKRHPLAALAHPTDHMMCPLIFCLGAATLGGDDPDCMGRRVHNSFQHSISLSAYTFG